MGTRNQALDFFKKWGHGDHGDPFLFRGRRRLQGSSHFFWPSHSGSEHRQVFDGFVEAEADGPRMRDEWLGSYAQRLQFDGFRAFNQPGFETGSQPIPGVSNGGVEMVLH